MTWAGTANALIEERIDELSSKLEEVLDSDVLTFFGEIMDGTDDAIRVHFEADRKPARRQRLAFIVQTPGGLIEVVERIVTCSRKHYREVDFFVPNFAMSAGTVLVMSGDRIFMDYYSILGPIDPQVEALSGNKFVPALGYLREYESLMEKADDGELNTAEMAVLLSKFDPGELYRYRQAKNLSISLLQDWLVKYKFKNWSKTKSTGAEVTEEKRRARAQEVATCLNNAEQWNSHGRGLSMETLSKIVKLEVDDFTSNQDVGKAVKDYYSLTADYTMKMGLDGLIHSPGSFTPLRLAR